MLRHQIAIDLTALEALAPAWQRLLESSQQPQVMRSPLWLTTWWRVFGPLQGRESRLVTFWRGPELVAVVPVLRRQVVGITRLELFGTGEREQDEICSEYTGAVAAPGEELPVAERFAELVRDGALGRWHQLDFTNLSSEDPMSVLLYDALCSVGNISFGVTAGASFARLPSSWAGYLDSLSSSRRQRARRVLKGFERWTGGEHSLHVAATATEASRGLELLETLHRARWQADGLPGAFASEHFRAFHRQVVPRLFDRGEVEIAWLLVRGRPVAAIYNLLCSNAARFYQSGRAPEIPANVSVGMVMQLYAIQRAIANGRREYDFLGGFGRHKADLSHEVRPLMRLRVTRRSAAAELFGAARALREAIRSWRRLTVPEPTAPPRPESLA